MKLIQKFTFQRERSKYVASSLGDDLPTEPRFRESHFREFHFREKYFIIFLITDHSWIYVVFLKTSYTIRLSRPSLRRSPPQIFN